MTASPRSGVPLRRKLRVALLWLLTIALPLPAQVVISEFCADNSTGILDEDGTHPDWIELCNTGSATVNLDGWFLTDDAADLTLWRFPSVDLLPKGYLVVFASGKNRTNAAAPLHTSFSLNAGGEYLGLVLPDGKTVASEFAPAFPPQRTDISYGAAQVVATNHLFTTGQVARYRVPADGALGTTWTQRGFADASWGSGPTALGYETEVPGLAVRYVKATVTVDSLATAEVVLSTPAFQTLTAVTNASVANFYNTGIDGHYGDNLVLPGQTVGVDVDDYVVEITGTLAIPQAGDWTFGVNSGDGFSLSVGALSLSEPGLREANDTLGVLAMPAAGDYPFRLVWFERSGGSTVEFFAAPGNLGAWASSGFRLVGDVSHGGLAARSVSTGNTTAGFRALLQTDVETAMHGVNSSLYARLPFNLSSTVPGSLTLNVRYDDGFIAYLNGTEVARRNAPAGATWNSAATAGRAPDQATVFEPINLSGQIPLLVAGTNVLALHALNVAAGDVDLLVDAELVDYNVAAVADRYFAVPTPGGVNSTGLVAFVADTRFSVDRGFYSNAFDLEITCATPGAAIYWTTNGTVPSATNGFLYTAPLRVAGTTTVRAAAFHNGYQPSNVDTQTYLFTADIIHQSPTGAAPPGWPASWGANTVDYGMDPTIVNNATWTSTLQEDLKAIPSFSVVLDTKALFDPATGIYANPGQDGAQWERPCSVELINPDGTRGFQINAGLRIRGGFSRSTDNPKHAFRFFFRQEYGEAKLKYPLFGDAGTDTFDALDLRTFQNYSWSFQGDNRGIFLRDQLSRDFQLAMGHQGERGQFYHLYLNGQYWGLYNTCERPEASYAATYYGGLKENYDVIKVEAGVYNINATDGNLTAWTKLYNLAKAGLTTDAACEFVQGNNPDGTRNPAYENLVDADNLIDYMLVIFYGGNLDAPISWFLSNASPNNWYGIRDRTGTNGFRFFVHDAEHTLLSVTEDRTGPFTAGDTSVYKSNPQWIWQKMLANPEFRMRAADRIHRHCFNNGVLTPAAAATRFLERKAEIDRAVVAESARWGDAKREPAFTRNDWLAAIGTVQNSYLPQRTATLLTQLRTKGAYPNVVAPAFSQHGGNIQAGYALGMSAPAGTIYYTLNGQDPRLRGGAILPGAQTYSSPVPLTANVTVKSRVRDTAGNWSALNEADFTLIQSWRDLVVTELMYHPASSPGVDADDFEFLELKNTGTNTLDLSGVTFTNGIRYTFSRGRQLDPGQFVVLIANPAAFTNRYPGVTYDDVYTGRLNNGGEQVALIHAAGNPIFSVTYADTAPWPIAADGGGFSLVPVNPNANPTPDQPVSWRASSTIGGSPGHDDPPAAVATIWITEALTHTDPPQLDSIELFNPNTTNVNLGGWFLTDDPKTPKKFRIPNGTALAAGGYLVFDEEDFDTTPGVDPSFNLSSYGEAVYLNSADAAGNLTGYSDGFPFPAAANGVSFGRHVISTGETHYPAQRALTLGSPNAGPLVGPIVINEVHYHPLPGDPEFIELKNITTTNVPLFDPAFPANTWKLVGLDYALPTGLTLAPGALLVVSETTPTLFRSRFSVPPETPVVGPFAGFLDNSGETLRLQRPDKPDLLPDGTVFVPYIDVDVLRYNNRAPWPVNADGDGSSLERNVSSAYGNDPANWKASPGDPSPGLANDGNRRPSANAGVDQLVSATFNPVPLSLSGYAADDQLPNGILSIRWNQEGGPGVVDFLDATATNTTALFPGVGSYQLKLTVSDGQLVTSDTVVVTIERPSAPVALVPAGASWAYWDQGSLPATDWTSPSFAEPGWMTGPAQLGYGDGDEATVVGYGPNSNARYTTTYFRHSLMVTNLPTIRSLNLRLLRDDGAIVYLNGTEVVRNNMPTDLVSYSTFASATVGGADESTFYSFPIDLGSLVEGRNVLAVEVHQSNASSSDVSFDLDLTADMTAVNAPPRADAGPDLRLQLPADALIDGTSGDDGLPTTPGVLTSTWSQVSGPAPVAFSSASTAHTRATFATAGTYILRLTASDGVFTTTDDTTVTVTGDTFESWRALYFTAPELANPAISGPDADPDADGHTNQQEYVAGTHPRQAASVLQFLEVNRTGDGVTLRFEAIAGRSYVVEFRTESNSGQWLVLASLPAGAADQLMDVEHLNPPATTFYRLLIPATKP